MITYEHIYIYIIIHVTCHIINQYNIRQLDDDLMIRKYAMEALDQGWALKNGQLEP